MTPRPGALRRLRRLHAVHRRTRTAHMPWAGAAAGAAARDTEHRARARAVRAAATLGGLGAAALTFGGAFLASSWLDPRLLGPTPAEAVRQASTFVIWLLTMAAIGAVLGAIQQPRERAVFRSIVAALGRIAQGDFGTRIKTSPARDAHPFSRLAHSINDMAVELHRMEGLRQEFISNVSHEIQSPLASIRGFAQALRADDLTPVQRLRYLQIIEAESGRLSKLSDDLLRLTTLHADAPGLAPRSYRLDRQLRRAVLAAEPQWSQKELEVEVTLPPLTVVADEDLMGHVWANLVHNAVKFTPAHGGVAVRLSAGRGQLLVEVADTGIGIGQEDQERVFERFFKADRGRDRTAGGNGLGLALVKEIVELHGGRVSVRSAPGRGATFAVALPAPTPHPPAEVGPSPAGLPGLA